MRRRRSRTSASARPSGDSLGLALIARNEESSLPRLLSSIDGAFDQVVLLDTGSTDRTPEIFEDWATAQDLRLGYRLEYFDWCDDFAAARNAADELLETDWLATADADDVIVKATLLRIIVGQVSKSNIQGIEFPYLLKDLDRRTSDTDFRLRLRRRGVSKWGGRLHENLPSFAPGYSQRLDPKTAPLWETDRMSNRPVSLARNMRILRSWIEAEPLNPVPLRIASVQALVAPTGLALDDTFAPAMVHLQRYRRLVLQDDAFKFPAADLSLLRMRRDGPRVFAELMGTRGLTEYERGAWLSNPAVTAALWGCVPKYTFFGQGLPHEEPLAHPSWAVHSLPPDRYGPQIDTTKGGSNE